MNRKGFGGQIYILHASETGGVFIDLDVLIKP